MDTLISLLKGVAPALATAVAGPAGGAAVGWIADLTGNAQNSLIIFSGLAVLGALLILKLPAHLINHQTKD